METSKWEGTKEKVIIEFCEDEAGYFFYEITSPPFETKKQAEANARLFTDALHTMQELHLLPSELALGFPMAHKELSEWKQNKIDELNQLREENAKLKLEIEEIKNKSLLRADKVEEQTGGKSLAEVLESEEKLKATLSEIRGHMYERATSYEVHDLINETLTKAGFPYEPED